jgi:ribosome-associated protein
MTSVRVDRSLTIPDDEIELTFSTSSGPGGQHANKAATRVDLTWNVDSSRALNERQRGRIRARLRNRIDARGNLRLSSDRHRSQTRNRADVTERFARIVAEAVQPISPRVPTAPTQGARQRRLESKRRRGLIKQNRRKRFDDY